MNRKLSLNGDDWLFKDFVGEDWVWRHAEKPDTRDVRWWRTGTVPGSVAHDVWRNGEIPDPYFERNSLLMEWIPARTWVYKKTFRADPAWAGKRVRLTFRGVDYEARFFLNGERIGRHAGMYAPASFEVGGLLRYGADNLLAVVIEPAPEEQPQVGETRLVHTHKSRMTYGWDFCPRMIHQGIWDDVELTVSDSVRIEDVFVRPRLNAAFDGADVSVSAALDAAEAADALLEIEIRYGGRVQAVRESRVRLAAGTSQVACALPIEEPKLWWPNGHGEQPLYEAVVRVKTEEEASRAGGPAVSDSRTVSFGIRSVELERNETADETALPYTFVVNGRKIYLKGWNWVPLDAMYGVERPGKLRRLLTLAKRANVNMLRVWGGGLIEKEAFYDLCSRFGIMVWQEFIQSSSGIANRPSADPAFVAMMAREAEAIIPRRRNHASLVLWCGGNELQDECGTPLDDREPVLAALHGAVRRLDPDRHWLPTSPTGRRFANSLANIERDPLGLHDVHGPWEHQGLTEHYTLYNRGASLLHSEFGVEGMTNRKALDATIAKTNQWPPSKDNPVYFHRGAWWINEPLVQSAFGGIAEIGAMIRASQFLQAEGLRYTVEANRRRKYRNSGTLPWQFNEPYPNAYCTSAIDYFAQPKPVYYAVAAAYEPVRVTASFPTIAWAGREAFEAVACASHSGERPLPDVRLEWAVRSANGGCVRSGALDAPLVGNASTRLAEIACPLDAIDGDAFFLDLVLRDARGETLSRNRYPFSRADTLKPLSALGAASLLAGLDREGDEWRVEIRNEGKCAAMSVWLEDDREPGDGGYAYFDRNGFHLLPGERAAVSVQWDGVPAERRRIAVGSWNARRLILR